MVGEIEPAGVLVEFEIVPSPPWGFGADCTETSSASALSFATVRMREIEEAEAETISAQDGQKKDPRGRKPGGDSEVARKLGTTRQEIDRTRKHIDAAERYPALQSKEWKRGEAIDAAATLDALDEPVREAVADMIQEPGIPKSTARKIIEGVASKPKKDQRQIAKLYRSDKLDDVTLAKTRRSLAGIDGSDPAVPGPRGPVFGGSFIWNGSITVTWTRDPPTGVPRLGREPQARIFALVGDGRA